MEVCDLEICSVHMCMESSSIGGGLPDFMQIFFRGELFNQFIAAPVAGQALFYSTSDCSDGRSGRLIGKGE